MTTSTTGYAEAAPARDEIEALTGATLLDFGTDWCGFCRAAAPHVEAALAARSGVRHLKIEDGPGRPLGRSYRIKLWPTLIVLRDGKELARVVRPPTREAVAEALAVLDTPPVGPA